MGVNVCEVFNQLHKAFLFNIPKGLRRLSYDLNGQDIRVLAVFDQSPKEFQKDCVFSALSEFNGHYVKEFAISVEFVVDQSTQAEDEVEGLSTLLFARYEAEEY